MKESNKNRKTWKHALRVKSSMSKFEITDKIGVCLLYLLKRLALLKRVLLLCLKTRERWPEGKTQLVKGSHLWKLIWKEHVWVGNARRTEGTLHSKQIPWGTVWVFFLLFLLFFQVQSQRYRETTATKEQRLGGMILLKLGEISLHAWNMSEWWSQRVLHQGCRNLLRPSNTCQDYIPHKEVLRDNCVKGR